MACGVGLGRVGGAEGCSRQTGADGWEPGTEGLAGGVGGWVAGAGARGGLGRPPFRGLRTAGGPCWAARRTRPGAGPDSLGLALGPPEGPCLARYKVEPSLP